MALVTNTYQTYAVVGIREDLSDLISNISRMDTPMLTAFKTGKAEQRLHEWLTDADDAPADNKQLEGDAATVVSRTPKVRLNNHCQILSKSASVTGTNEASLHAGIGKGKVMAEEIVKRSRELKKDLEYAICAINNAKAAGSISVPREFASIQSWIATNTSFGTGGADPTGDGTDARTDGTQRAVTEAQLADVMQQIYQAGGGKPTMISAGTFNHAAISHFVGGGTKTFDAADQKVYSGVKIYITEQGYSLTLVPNWIQRTRDVLILDPKYWAMAWLRNWEGKKLAVVGDSSEYQILGEVTLESLNEKASGGIYDLTTS